MVLGPEDRRLATDCLRPPDGYGLDQAIGTTFTLDLLAVIAAPLAFARFDRERGVAAAEGSQGLHHWKPSAAMRTVLPCSARRDTSPYHVPTSASSRISNSQSWKCLHRTICSLFSQRSGCCGICRTT